MTPCKAALDAATAIANYCSTRFNVAGTDSDACLAIDVPWFAEKIQAAMQAEVDALRAAVADRNKELEVRREMLNRMGALVGEHNCWMKAEEEIQRAVQERDRYRAALEFFAYSSLPAARISGAVSLAVMRGANVSDLSVVKAIDEGRWRYCEKCGRYVAGEYWSRVQKDEKFFDVCHRHEQE